MLSGVAGLGMAQPSPLDSLFGSMGTNTMAGLGGFGTGLQSANSGNDLLQLAALLGGSQQQNVTFQPAQLLQVRQALAQQQATQVAAQQAELQKRIETEAAAQAAVLVKAEHEKQEKQKQKKTQDANAAKQDEDDDTTSRGSANGRSQGARKRKAIAEATAEKQKVEKERGELREALDIIEAHLGTCTRQYYSEDGTRPSRVKKTTVTRALRSVSRKGARSKEPEIVDLDKEESVSERVARLIALQVGARGSSSPDGRRPPIRQSPCLSGKSDRSTASDMRSGSLPKNKLKSLSFAEALMSPTPEEKKARGRVDAKKRRSKKPEEGKEEEKKEAFKIRQSFDNIGRELISLVSTTLREIGKQDIEGPTKADNDMLLPLAQKMTLCKVFDRCEDLAVRTELVEELGNAYGFDMARNESLECYLQRMLYCMFYHEKPFQAQLGVMAFLEAQMS